MPTYEYECQDYGYRFEKFQKITSQPLTQCPKCKGKIKRLITAGGGFILKGSGFYANDYKKTDSSCCGMTNLCDNPKRCCEKEK